MFEPQEAPRIFALPCGVDFPAAFAAGLRQRMAGAAPLDMARVEIIVNTARMRRRLISCFDAGPAAFLPRIRLVTELGEAPLDGLPPAAPPLRLRLELAALIARLIEAQPDLAPGGGIYGLADSLAALLAEMHGEGVPPALLQALDVPDLSGHWQRSLTFLRIVESYFEATAPHAPTAEARLRAAVQKRIAAWQAAPPAHPVIVAGSTGSRGTTQMLMQAVARLPQGALVLPGFDFDMPAAVWARLAAEERGDDHPQFRFARLLDALDLAPADVPAWHEGPAPVPERARLISLALRPAPVTDQWRREGPAFEGVAAAMEGVTLVEAQDPRAEAGAIALALRGAAERGETAVLITPDRGLTRQVTAALSRWGIEPDDSAGAPLAQSPPGRLLLQVAALYGRRLTPEPLVVLLKHPLVAAGGGMRGDHLRYTRDLELWLRRDGPAFPDARALRDWCARYEGDAPRQAWLDWLLPLVEEPAALDTRALAEHVEDHVARAEALAAGPGGTPDPLWARAAGRRAAEIVAGLRREAHLGGTLDAAEYGELFRTLLDTAEVQDPDAPHGNIMIRGTLESRVETGDLVILAGLNEGIWPGLPAPDPWLSRDMRAACFLPLPERQTGLAAHDFQQAAGAPRLMLTRARRDAEAETVPSRWLNRLTNLLGGMSDEGAAALAEARARGNVWLRQADALDRGLPRVAPATRPSPRPPVSARPRRLSVTRIEELIRDPYAIYAQYVLALKPLPPLHRSPDAPLRGEVLHAIMERFIATPGPLSVARLMAVTDEVLAEQAPWPAARRLWRARIERLAPKFIETEHLRQVDASPAWLEASGKLHLDQLDFLLTGTADRIDRRADGSLVIYDYKTGALPSEKQIAHFTKQLLLEAVMAERGAFEGMGNGAPVASVEYIGLGASFSTRDVPITPDTTRETAEQLVALLSAYERREQGYTSLRAVEALRFQRDYDHLARFGEWDRSAPPVPEDVGEDAG